MAHTASIEAKVDHLAAQLDVIAKSLIHDLYGPDGLPWGTRFSELEDVGVAAGQRLARMMMQNASAEQAEAYETAPESYHACPTCGDAVALARRAQTAAAAEHPPPNGSKTVDRSLQSRAGQVEWSEPERYCSRCRRAFFPSGAGVRPSSR